MQSITSRIGRIVGAGLLALGLTIITGGIWSLLLVINITTSPAIPWAVIVMAMLVWLIWQYLGGKWWPPSTSEARRRSLRAGASSPRVFAWALLAGGFSITALTGFWIVLSQLVKIPGNPLPDFSRYPWLTVALVLVTASLVGAVTEEAGFRGYLQGALEQEVGGLAAIVITALVIAPAHGLTQGFVWPTLLFYFFVDLTFGITAFLTRSILPGIVTHAIGLLTFFTLIWPYDSTRPLVSAGGADVWFWMHAAQMLLFAGLAILAFRNLAKVAGRERAAQAPGQGG